MFEKILTQYHWLKLTNDERAKMRETFGIVRSKGTMMVGNTLTSDGSDENDLRVVNETTMKAFLDDAGSADGFDNLFERTIRKIDQIIENERNENAQSSVLAETQRRLNDTANVTANVIVTIDNLPLDAQAVIFNHLKSLSKAPSHDSKENGTEEAEQEGNGSAAEDSGSGSKKTKAPR